MIRSLILAALLLLGGCGQIGGQIAIAGASYVASLNNLGAQTLRFVDDKEQREACSPVPKTENP